MNLRILALAATLLACVSCLPSFGFDAIETSIDSSGAIKTANFASGAEVGKDFYCAATFASGNAGHTVLLGLRRCGGTGACGMTGGTAPFVGKLVSAGTTDGKSRARAVLEFPDKFSLTPGVWQCFAVTDKPDHKPGEGAAETAKDPRNYMAADDGDGLFHGDYGVAATFIVK